MAASSPEALNTRRTWLSELAACASAGVILGVVGPFGSFFNDGLVVRVAYWTAVLLISGLLFGAALRGTWPRAMRAGLSPWVWGPALVLVISLPTALLSRLLEVGLWPGIRYAVGPVEWYGQANVVGLIYVGLYVVLRTKAARRAGRDIMISAPALPRRLDRSVVCLQMEDHYVRIHTLSGSELVLMSLSQAIAGLDGVEGIRTHRSWWVAKAAVTDLVEDGRKLRLRLANGVEAPISRARVAALRAAGWL